MTHREDQAPILSATAKPQVIHLNSSQLAKDALPHLKKILTVSTGGLLLSAAADPPAQTANLCYAGVDNVPVDCATQPSVNELPATTVAAVNSPAPEIVLSPNSGPNFSGPSASPPSPMLNADSSPAGTSPVAIARADADTQSPAVGASANDSETVTLRPGTEGQAVEELQRSLNAIGFEVEVNGTFDEATRDAVEQFQSDRGLAASGVVDSDTRTSLMAAEIVANPSADSRDRSVLLVQNSGDRPTKTAVDHRLQRLSTTPETRAAAPSDRADSGPDVASRDTPTARAETATAASPVDGAAAAENTTRAEAPAIARAGETDATTSRDSELTAQSDPVLLAGAPHGAETPTAPAPTTPAPDKMDHHAPTATPSSPSKQLGGTIDNTAIGTSRETQPQGASANVPIAGSPILGFNKSVTEVINPDGQIDSDQVVDQAGDIIKYTMRVSNLGNVTLSGVTIVDSLLAENPAENVTLRVDEDLFFQGEYVVTQADLDGDGSYIYNEATFSSHRTEPKTDGEAVPIRKIPALRVEKQATNVDRKNDNKLNAVGDVVEYAIIVTNTGNQTLTNIQVNDPRIGSQSLASLAPGQSQTFVGRYVLTQQDIDSNGGGDGDLDNTVIVTADQIAPAQDFVELDLEQNPAIDIEKRVLDVDPAGDGVLNNAGETIHYEVIVTNTGNQTLNNVIVTDPLLGGTIDEGFSLLPGASKSYKLTYTITQADLDNNGAPINAPEFLNAPQP